MTQLGRRLVFFFLISFCFSLLMWEGYARHPGATIRGFVTDASDGQPLQDVNLVLLQGDTFVTGTISDRDGFYTLNQIPQGTYIFRVSYVGYEAISDTVRLLDNYLYQFNFALQPSEGSLEELIVEDEYIPVAARVTAGQQTVRPADVDLIPGPDVSGDLATYLVTLPGVVAVGDRGGQVYIRGGEPAHNMVLIDGMYVYQPFHVLGFYSAIPSDILARADVFAGGYGSLYSGRVSSVIDVKTRSGNKKRLAGALSVAPFVSMARLEGPLVKDRISFIASFRESVIEQGVSQYIDADVPYRFGDAFAKVHAILNANNQLSFSWLSTHDTGNVTAGLEEQEEVRWQNNVYGVRYLMVPPAVPVRAEVLFSLSSLNAELGLPGEPRRRSRINSFHAAINGTIFAGKSQVNWGGFLRSSEFPLELGGFYQNLQADVSRVPKAGMYVEPDIYLGGGFSLRPGVALQIAAQNFEFFFTVPDTALTAEVRIRSGTKKLAEPRLRLVWEGGAHQLSAAVGRYHQEVVGLNDRRDATSVFTGWTGTPSGELTRATHYLLGYRVTLNKNFEASAEGYHKRLSELFMAEWTAFPQLTTELQTGSGNIYGVDFRFEARWSQFYGYVTYGLSSVKYRIRQPEFETLFGSAELSFRPPHDRRHQVNVLLSGEVGNFSLSARWHYGSGLPYNQVRGFDGFVLLDGPVDVFETPYQQRVIYDRPYGGTLPAYHRLDLSVERTFPFDRFSLTAQAGVINVYNRTNLFALDVFTLERTDQLPIVPTIGIKMEF